MLPDQISEKKPEVSSDSHSTVAKVLDDIRRDDPGLANKVKAAPVPPEDNSLLHLAALAVKSTWNGFTEPVVGGMQLAEQTANSLGLKVSAGVS